jgi:hypothetical protein
LESLALKLDDDPKWYKWDRRDGLWRTEDGNLNKLPTVLGAKGAKGDLRLCTILRVRRGGVFPADLEYDEEQDVFVGTDTVGESLTIAFEDARCLVRRSVDSVEPLN